jgi:hypothetical protein
VWTTKPSGSSARPRPRRLGPRAARLGALALCLCALALPGRAAESLRVGLGTAALPTPAGGPLAGYGSLRDRSAEGELDPPEARALVFDGPSGRVALLALDVVIARPAIRDRLLEDVQRLDIDALAVVATHTHSGPGGYVAGWLAERVTAGSYDARAPDRLAEAAALALGRAVDDLAPAAVAAVEAELELARNRRFEDGRRERALPVLRVDFPDGRAPILLFAYGAHPTVLSPRSRAYSADYAGAARAWLEARGWRALYLPGPLGDQEPTSQLGPLWPKDVGLQVDQMREIGARLGEAVLAAAVRAAEARAVTGQVGAVPSPGPYAVERWVDAPDVRMRRFCSLWWLGPFVSRSVKGFFSPRVPLQAMQIGPALLLALPAEPTSATGESIRAGLPPGRVPFVIAHANDWIGYVVTPATYERGGYEACMSLHGPEFGPWLVDEALATLRALDARSVAARAAR